MATAQELTEQLSAHPNWEVVDYDTMTPVEVFVSEEDMENGERRFFVRGIVEDEDSHTPTAENPNGFTYTFTV